MVDLLSVSWRPIKEPRGMIRLIQILFAIIAFATTSGFDSTAKLTVKCGEPPAPGPSFEFHVKYPFSDEFKLTTLKACNASDEKSPFLSNASIAKFEEATSSQFWVTTGVLSMLYASGIVVVYVFAPTTYAENKLVPFVDLVLTVVLTGFWFLGWCSWVANYGNVKSAYYDSPKLYCNEMAGSDCSVSGVNFGKLVVSLIAGFGDVMLWGASCWFVFKETAFHQTATEGTLPGYTNHNQQIPSPS